MNTFNTYVPTDEGWLYLADVKDIHTCELVGHALGQRMTTELVGGALMKATAAKRPVPGLIHHSDRGAQHCGGLMLQLMASTVDDPAQNDNTPRGVEFKPCSVVAALDNTLFRDWEQWVNRHK